MAKTSTPPSAANSGHPESRNSRTLRVMLRWSLLAVLGIGLFAAGGLTYTKAGTQKILGELEPTTSTAPPRLNEVSAVARCKLIPKQDPNNKNKTIASTALDIFVNGDIKTESLTVALYNPSYTPVSTSGSPKTTTSTKTPPPSSTKTPPPTSTKTPPPNGATNTWEPWDRQVGGDVKDPSGEPIVLSEDFPVNGDKSERRILWIQYTDNAGHAGSIVIAASECTS